MNIDLEHVDCDLCGSDTYRERYRKPDNWLRGTIYQFPVVECTACGLVYVNPRPTPTAMAHFYPSDYHGDRASPEHLRRYAIQKNLIPDLSGKVVLDIGCAQGDFLSYLLDSGPAFHAHGVDAFSKGVIDPRIAFTRGTFTGAGYADAQFDMLMAWAVFEHLHTPMAYFDEAARVLKPGGQLLVLVTNSESAYGRLAQTEDVPRHTYHYSRETLARYGEESGMELQRIDYRDDIFDGRGFGSFSLLTGRALGFTWEKEMLGTVRRHQQLGMRFGRMVDRLVFSAHWESRLQCNGIMVATYAKA